MEPEQPDALALDIEVTTKLQQFCFRACASSWPLLYSLICSADEGILHAELRKQLHGSC